MLARAEKNGCEGSLRRAESSAERTETPRQLVSYCRVLVIKLMEITPVAAT